MTELSFRGPGQQTGLQRRGIPDGIGAIDKVPIPTTTHLMVSHGVCSLLTISKWTSIFTTCNPEAQPIFEALTEFLVVEMEDQGRRRDQYSTSHLHG